MTPPSESRWAQRAQNVRDHFRLENGHDLDGVMATFGEMASFTMNGEPHEGKAAVRAFYAGFFEGFPDLGFEIKEIHVGDKAIPVELILRGTHTRTWNGIPPTGRHFEVPVCAVFTFDDADRIIGERGYFDSALMLRQLELSS